MTTLSELIDLRQQILARAMADDEPDDLSGTSLSPAQRHVVQTALERAAEREALESTARAEPRPETTGISPRPRPISVPGGGLDPYGPTTSPDRYGFRTWLIWLAPHG